METHVNKRIDKASQGSQLACDCCQETNEAPKMPRRDFFTTAGGAVLGASALGGVLPVARVLAQVNPTALVIQKAAEQQAKAPESLVKVLYETLSPNQREQMCFAWDHQDPKRGLLRSR